MRNIINHVRLGEAVSRAKTFPFLPARLLSCYVRALCVPPELLRPGAVCPS
jgi:hypothetical protein